MKKHKNTWKQSPKSCDMAGDFWKSQPVCTSQAWIVAVVFIGDKDSKSIVSLNLYSSLKGAECYHFIPTALLEFAVGCVTTILQMGKKKRQRSER